MQLLVLLQVFLEVEGLAAAGLRAGEGLLVHMLVFLVVLPFGGWGEAEGRVSCRPETPQSILPGSYLTERPTTELGVRGNV